MLAKRAGDTAAGKRKVHSRQGEAGHALTPTVPRAEMDDGPYLIYKFSGRRPFLGDCLDRTAAGL
jgi:hypothetical protein